MLTPYPFSSRLSKTLDCRGRPLRLGEKTLLMGILNLTPDSFYDGGHFVDIDQAVAHARAMEAAGADIIDLGGESTRPHAEVIDEVEELRRILPVLKTLLHEVSVSISVDTYKPAVAEAALAAGAHMINDICGLQQSGDMAGIIARSQAPVVITHNNRNAPCSGDIVEAVITSLSQSITLALDAGIAREAIILDPGIGFGKTSEQNLGLLARLGEIKALGLPLLLGTSRKSFIGDILDLPTEERLEGTLATSVLAITQGADILRVHDIETNRRVVQVTEAILKCSDNKTSTQPME